MKKITQGSMGMFALLAVFVGLSSQVYAYTPITSTLDLGQTSTNVRNLQVFFADNSAIYPEGMVTGFFGGLTRSAVQRFQESYGIVNSGTAATTGYGRVGPTTMSKVNSLINNGGWTGVATSDTTGPGFYNIAQSQNNTSATFSFNTSENTMARVVYSTNPLMFNEGDMNSNGFGAIGGNAMNSASGMSSSHSVTISNLQPNTIYYYTVVATDAAGNVSVWGPNSTLRTAQ